MTGFLRTFCDADMAPAALQQPADVAVVIPTLLRPTLIRAVQGVFRQNFAGRIHVMIGIDTLDGPLGRLDEACAGRPSNVVVQALYPGYSTSVRHGGVTRSNSGGALRCVLSLLANSRYIAYLDDDNWFGPDHLRTMLDAVRTAEWAYSWRWFVHPDTAKPICIDAWESTGPGRGMFQERFGGFVDTNCLILDKQACEKVLLAWNAPLPGDDDGQSEDRMVYDMLQTNHRPVATNQPTTFYQINPHDPIHPIRLHMMGKAYALAGEGAT